MAMATSPAPVQSALEQVSTFTAEDLQGLRDYWTVYERVYEEYLAHLMEKSRAIPQFARLMNRMGDAAFEDRFRRARALFRDLVMEGHWEPYLEDVHDRAIRYAEGGVEFRNWYVLLAAIQYFMLPKLREAYEHDVDKLIRAVTGMQRHVDITMVVLGEAYQAARADVIARQQQAIREISTPVLQIRPGLCVVPIIGFLDSARSQLLMDTTLSKIRSRRTRVLILDVTGVASIDTDVANRLLQTVEAAQLLGAATIITGISSSVALTIVSLGLDLPSVITKGDLQSGIEEAEVLLKRWEIKPAPPGANGTSHSSDEAREAAPDMSLTSLGRAD